jgi:hypothetical protein
MKFQLNAKEVKNLEVFIRKQSKQKKLSGGRPMAFEFHVSPTGIGTVIEVENMATGIMCNLTDYDSW